MCLAVPSRVLELGLDGTSAVVEAFGERRRVDLLLLDEPVRPGDYLLVQAGGHAYERMEPQAARETLVLLEQLFAADGSDLLAWSPARGPT